nr:MAG TPA: hypothetical protein [Bacteriophage sp.]
MSSLVRITRWVGFIDFLPPLFLSVPFSPSIQSLNLGEIWFFRLFELLTQAVNFRLCGSKRRNHPPLEPLVEHLAPHRSSFLQSLSCDSQALEL